MDESPFEIDRKDLIETTTRTVLENMVVGITLIVLLQWIFLGDLRSAMIVGATIPFALFFGVLSIGGDYAARKADLPNVFLLLVVGLILMFMLVTQYLSDRRARGEPILPRRLRTDRRTPVAPNA